MTDTQLRDAAIVQLKQTTVGYVNKYWTTPPAGSFWEKGLTLLAQISPANATARDAAVTDLKKTTKGYNATGKWWKAAAAELAKITDTPPPSGWTKVASENDAFTLAATAEVRYGAGSAWASKVFAPGTYVCSNSLFGDAAPGVVKTCEKRPSAAAPTPLPKNVSLSGATAKVTA